MNEKMHEAQRLYFTQSLTQREIAARIGVTERTIYNWIRNHAWDRLREASLRAPAIIAENISSQIVELQNSIAAREPGKRFPTMEEAEITRKLVTCLDKVKKQPSLSQSQQTLRQFNHWLMSRCKDDKFCWHVRAWAGDFIQAEAQMGYAPYQLEYGAENISPVSILFAGNDAGPGAFEVLPETNPPAPATGKYSVAENNVDKTAQAPATTASQPLSFTTDTPEKIGNIEHNTSSSEGGREEADEETLAALIEQFFEEQNIYPDEQRQLKQILTTAFIPTGNNSPERKTQAGNRETLTSKASQPFPVTCPIPEKAGKPDVLGTTAHRQ